MTSPYLHTRLRSYDEARLDILTERLMIEQAKLRNLPLDHPDRAECVRAIRALDAELDGLDNLRAT